MMVKNGRIRSLGLAAALGALAVGCETTDIDWVGMNNAMNTYTGTIRNIDGESSGSSGSEFPNNVIRRNDGSYVPAPGYTWANPNGGNNDLRVIPKNVIRRNDGSYVPAPGYTWANPNGGNNDLRVIKRR